MGYTKGRSGVSSVDTSTKHVLAQYGIFDDDEEEDFEKELSVGEEDEVRLDLKRKGGEDSAAGVAAAGDGEDEVAAVSSKRPRLTAALVEEKLDVLMGPQFRALSEIKSPGQWVAKLMKLYESWADTVFPQVEFDTFLKRLEKMSSQQPMKDALWTLARTRAKIEAQEAIEREEQEMAGLIDPQVEEDEEEVATAPIIATTDNNVNVDNDSDELILIWD